MHNAALAESQSRDGYQRLERERGTASCGKEEQEEDGREERRQNKGQLDGKGCLAQGMGLFFNGAENWGPAFRSWPAVTTAAASPSPSQSVTA